MTNTASTVVALDLSEVRVTIVIRAECPPFAKCVSCWLSPPPLFLPPFMMKKRRLSLLTSNLFNRSQQPWGSFSSTLLPLEVTRRTVLNFMAYCCFTYSALTRLAVLCFSARARRLEQGQCLGPVVGSEPWTARYSSLAERLPRAWLHLTRLVLSRFPFA